MYPIDTESRKTITFGLSFFWANFMVMQNYINSANDISDPSNDAKGVLIDAMGVERWTGGVERWLTINVNWLIEGVGWCLDDYWVCWWYCHPLQICLRQSPEACIVRLTRKLAERMATVQHQPPTPYDLHHPYMTPLEPLKQNME